MKDEHMSDNLPSEMHLRLVSGVSNPALFHNIMTMWLDAGVLSQAEASRRLHEVVYAIVDDENTVQGVTTAYPGRIPGRNEPVWFLRMFIKNSARKASGLKNRSAFQWDAFEKTCEFLKQTSLKTHLGIVMVTENRKLWSERWQKRLGDKGWELLGRDQRENVIYLLRFSPGS